MRAALRLACAALLLANLGACRDYLSGPGLTENPNAPTQATIGQLFFAMQVGQFTLFEGQLARDAAMFTQQMAGVSGNSQRYGSSYDLDEKSAADAWGGFYTGGGLVDLRKIEQLARAQGDAQWLGIAEIWEAMSMGTAASVWGDIPYREAVSAVSTPRLDPQEQVYRDVIALLDDGIALLVANGPGPRSLDLVYGGDTASWRRAAYTLKARFWLHMAERQGAPAYQAALAAAERGISAAPASVTEAVHGQAAGDFRSTHDNTPNNGNVWQLGGVAARGEIVAGQALVTTLLSRGNDPRLAGYFDPAAGSKPPAFRGADEHGLPAGGTPSSFLNAAVRRALNFRQPLVTWSENQLIMAEAKYELGDAAGALANLNAVRAAVGLAALPGPVTLEQIMTEKYIVQFQNIDAWSDYKRTCIPDLRPGGSQSADIPGRLPYPAAERLANPNIPLPTAAPVRNWDDPTSCAMTR